MNSISYVKADGGYLVVSLPEGNADLPLLLSDYHLVIQPNGGVDDPNASLGTGPYKVASFEPGVRVTFEKTTNDWLDDRGYVESVEIVVHNAAPPRTEALSSGQDHFQHPFSPHTTQHTTQPKHQS